ncbi:hypothetical protein GQ600_7316 [Phytophthora cactorum]|nr:hypothetical protein GQ600_7316 [Phytophthora cactorum]
MAAWQSRGDSGTPRGTPFT